MEKRVYEKPAVQVVEIQDEIHLADISNAEVISDFGDGWEKMND